MTWDNYNYIGFYTFLLKISGTIDTIGVEIQDFQDLKPNPEISSRDLYFGRDQVWDEV